MVNSDKFIQIYVSYVENDIKQFGKLIRHLKNISKTKNIKFLSHKDVISGATTDNEISRFIQEASIILILMSTNYLASTSYEQEEVQESLKRPNDVRIIPIIVAPCFWKESPFHHLTPLPERGEPISQYRDRETAWLEVEEGIRQVIDDMSGNSTRRTENSDNNSFPVDPSQQTYRKVFARVSPPGSPDRVSARDEEVNFDTNHSHSSSSQEEQSKTEVVPPLTRPIPPILQGEKSFLTRRRLLIGGGVTAVIAGIGGATLYSISHFSASSSFKSHLSSPTNTSATPSSTTSTNSSLPSSKSPAASWTSFGSNAQNTRYKDQEHGLHPTRKIAWSYSTGGAIQSSAAVADGVAYVNSFDGFLHAIKDGKPLWSYDTSQDVVSGSWESKLNCSSPTVINSIVYFGSRTGFLYALDAKTGKVKWKQKTGGLILASPIVVNNIVYIVSFDGKIYAFDAISGEQKQSPAHVGDDRYIASPAVDGDSIYIASQDTHVYALDLGSFGPNWVSPQLGIISATPAIDRDHVYVCARSKADRTSQTLYALKKNDKGRIDWPFHMSGSSTSESEEQANNISFDSSPAIAYDKVYIGSNNGNLYAIDTKTGTQAWSYKTDGSIYSSPTVADGVVYVGSNDGNIYAVNAQTGDKLWKLPMRILNSHRNLLIASPTVVQGWLYIGCTNSEFYALPPSSN